MKRNRPGILFFTVMAILCWMIAAGFTPDKSDRAVYLSMMDKMMDQMMKQSSTVSPETDFLQQMIPHHQGAIEMAGYEISHGKDFEMIQLAKSIQAEQQTEVQLMNTWLHSPSILKSSVPKGYAKEMQHTMDVMMETMMHDQATKTGDYAFAQIMIPHHQAAIDMAKVVLKYASDPTVTAFAKLLISNEQVEIEQMSSFTK
ncbi:DUF305 domain-containing protein [Taibaiella soli]|uniref:DUF305 domain-containing protein n=1 Tax=Taibaiella soli TaxID=1649169 RepID=A0A2W2BGT1_9BACT|nr:DUF305 domain-containing protein [Taibaiella soli]PZF72696.1 hypothetical protein DN068_12590 [Taibaiella soli]